MKEPTIGFIGTGNMGGALAKAAAKNVPGERILLHNRTEEKAKALAGELHCRAAGKEETARNADYLFLGVKPQGMAGLLEELAPVLGSRQSRVILVTMAAGLTMEKIQKLAGKPYPVIRIMPNTPAAVGEGMILYACSEDVSPEEEREFLSLMAGAGRFSKLPENLIDAGTAVSGCGPAFVDLFLEALADGGVACGLPRAQALEFAAQMTLGAAKLLLETGENPETLKDAVCSPGGSTIQGVRRLEQGGFRSAVTEAVISAWEKSRALG